MEYQLQHGADFHGHLSEEPLMEEIGGHYGKTAAQATLRWHIQNEIVVIPKSVHQERIISNADVFNFELSAEDMERIDALDGKQRFSWDSTKFDGDAEKARKMRTSNGGNGYGCSGRNCGSASADHPARGRTRGEEWKIEATIRAYREAARTIADMRPDTIIITSPHTVLYAEYFHVSPGKAQRKPGTIPGQRSFR